MALVERQQAVLTILQNLHQTQEKGLKELFWSELNFAKENKPLSPPPRPSIKRSWRSWWSELCPPSKPIPRLT